MIVIAFAAGLTLLIGGLVLFTVLTVRQAEVSTPPLGCFAEVDGARLHYVDRGTGPVVVLIHGLGGNLRNFYRVIDLLSATCRVVAVDRPGSGYSRMLSGGHPGLRCQATIIAHFIEKLGLYRPVLVGHSLGGALSLALALDHPDHVRALVLISTLSEVERVPPAAFESFAIRSLALRRLIAWTLMAPLGKLTRQVTLRAVFAPEMVPTDFNVESGAGLGLRPNSFITASTEMMTVADELAAMTARYPSMTPPVDVIFGRQDPILDYRAHGERLVAAIPNSTLHLIEGGHMIPVTEAEEIANVIGRATMRA